MSNNEWYTPARYVDAAREVMGGIDLDPASCAAANKFVKAERYFAKEQNGLLQDWTCCSMWLNPPYGLNDNGKSNIELWSRKLQREYHAGNVKQAILLCMSNTESSWFVPLWNYPICFPSPRVMFHRPDGTLDHHLSGSCFVYLGPNESRFIEVFSRFGRIVRAIDNPPARPIMRELWQEVTP